MPRRTTYIKITNTTYFKGCVGPVIKKASHMRVSPCGEASEHERYVMAHIFLYKLFS